jgi:oligopeptide transport system permease protein
VGRYVVRRILQMIPVFLGTTILIFTMEWAVPGDPFASRCGQRPCPPAFVAYETARLHLDKPLPVQYGYYLWNVLHLNFGTTTDGTSVLTEFGRAFPITFKLTIVAILFELVLGIGMGVLAATRPGGWFDNLSLVGTLIAISLPIFVIGYLLQYVLGVRLGLFPVTVAYGAPWSNLILPGFVLATISLSYCLRLTRASVMETLQGDYVRTAIAKGLPRSLVWRRHVIRNSLIPVLTFIGTDVGVLLAGAIITEGIFNIQGIGGLTYEASRLREGSIVVSVATIIVLIVLVVNLLVDLLYAVLDPRIRYE